MKAKEKRRCAHCGKKDIENPRAIYCSKSCKTLAWMARKKPEQENNLAGTQEIESESQIKEVAIPITPQIKEQQISKPKSQPSDFPAEDFSFPEQELKPQQQNVTPEQKNISCIDQQIFTQEDYDELTEESTGNKNNSLDWNNNPGSDYNRKNPAWRNNLPLDQQMAFELSGGINYDDLFGNLNSKQEQQATEQTHNPELAPVFPNAATEWQPKPFPEPMPPQVKPVYETKIKRIFTPESEKLIQEVGENEKQLARLNYEKNILESLYCQLRFNFTKICKQWKPNKKYMRGYPIIEYTHKSFGAFIQEGTGCEIGSEIAFTLINDTQANHDLQISGIKEKQNQFAEKINGLTERNKKIRKQLEWYDAKMTVSENVLMNKPQYENYQSLLKAWEQRKATHEEQQIRERKTYIEQQEKIQQLQQTEQTPLPQESNNPLAANNTGQNTVKPQELKQVQQSKPTVPEKKVVPVNNTIKKSTIGLIVNSRDVHQYAGEMLQLSGRHGKFIGNPPARFMAIVHGQPGAGKSTYSSQIGKYLADNCGKVIYISGEEGLSATLEARLKRTDGKSDNLYFVDCRSLEDIFEHVKKNRFRFIIVDSLKHLGIDYAGLLDLKNHYENESIIFIQQSTKDGKMAGEQALKHEIDIEIIVSGGYAEIGKTRADNSKTGSMFDIFPEENRTPPDEDVEVI